jgi:hypothetical protein
MLTIRVLYDNNTDFIVPIVNNFKEVAYIELLNMSTSKKRSKIRKLQEDFGSKNFPLIIFQDENLINFNAIWSENTPDWNIEITKKLNE